MRSPIRVGMNGRFFPGNFRPALQEIAFAAAHGFEAMQFQGIAEGVGELQLGSPPEAVGAALRDASIEPVMEIIVWLNPDGSTPSGKTPLAILEANLPAITALGCTCVHWHVAMRERVEASALARLEAEIVPQFAAGVALASSEGFRFGVEHNEPIQGLFQTPSSAAALLEAVPGLGFVWDLNHTRLDHLEAFLALAPRMTMLHVADTPLPDTNHHLPLGQGNLDIQGYIRSLLRRGFDGPAILEIGGLPKSGGYGKDTDEALIHSRAVLVAAREESTSA